MRTYFTILFVSLGTCFALQSIALKAVGGRTIKSESNFFSSLGRIQAGALGQTDIMVLGSSITGRLPDRAQGFDGVANLGCDGGNAMDTLRAIDRGILPTAPWVLVETNTLSQALNGQPSEIGNTMQGQWFRVGLKIPALASYSRPSAFFYSRLLKEKIGTFDLPANDDDLRVTQGPVSVRRTKPVALNSDEHALIEEFVGIARRLVSRGTRVILVWLPPARRGNSLPPPWVTEMAVRSGALWWDLGQVAPAELIELTDNVHMAAGSAARTTRTIQKVVGSMNLALPSPVSDIPGSSR